MANGSVEFVDELNTAELLIVISSNKYRLALSSILAGLVAFAIVSLLPNIYRSEVTLAPAIESKQGIAAGISGQLGGLASLAGINLGGGIDKTALAIETLKSRVFIVDFAKAHELVVPLLAAKSWDDASQQWVIDPEVYDINTKVWVPNSRRKSSEPSDMEIYTKFIEMLSINQEKKTQIVTLSLESLSPKYAQLWAGELVSDINSYIKKRDIEQAERSIEYLSNEIRSTSIAQMQAILFQLIEEQKKTIMLASVRDGYVFKTIDPSFLPEEKIKPKRLMIVMVSIFIAPMVLTFFLLITHKSGQK